MVFSTTFWRRREEKFSLEVRSTDLNIRTKKDLTWSSVDIFVCLSRLFSQSRQVFSSISFTYIKTTISDHCFVGNLRAWSASREWVSHCIHWFDSKQISEIIMNQMTFVFKIMFQRLPICTVILVRVKNIFYHTKCLATQIRTAIGQFHVVGCRLTVNKGQKHTPEIWPFGQISWKFR